MTCRKQPPRTSLHYPRPSCSGSLRPCCPPPLVVLAVLPPGPCWLLLSSLHSSVPGLQIWLLPHSQLLLRSCGRPRCRRPCCCPFARACRPRDCRRTYARGGYTGPSTNRGLLGVHWIPSPQLEQRRWLRHHRDRVEAPNGRLTSFLSPWSPAACAEGRRNGGGREGRM